NPGTPLSLCCPRSIAAAIITTTALSRTSRTATRLRTTIAAPVAIIATRRRTLTMVLRGALRRRRGLHHIGRPAFDFRTFNLATQQALNGAQQLDFCLVDQRQGGAFAACATRTTDTVY